MIRHSFCHCPGLGEATERRLWEAGITAWSDATADRLPPRHRRLPDWLAASEEALTTHDYRPFGRLLGGRHAWRWFDLLRDRAVYLDIETTGGPPGRDAVTVVACYDGREATCFVADENLHEFPLYVSEFELLVTYNGRTFDVPHLRARFAALRLPPVHLDLRYPLAALGYRGGLKAIEIATGLARDDGLTGVDGWFAVLLWERHQRGDARALPTLLRYAAEDVMGLEPLAELAYNDLSGPLPVPSPTLGPTPRRPLDWPYSLELLTELHTVRAAWGT